MAEQPNENKRPGEPAGNGAGSTEKVPHLVGRLIIGCFALVFLFSVLMIIVCAIVGLTTGYLYLPGRGGTLELYGVWARIVSAIVLLFIPALVFLTLRGNKKNRRPKILGDRDYQ